MPRNRNLGSINNFQFPPEFLRTLPHPDKANIFEKSPQVPSNLCYGEPLPVEPKYGYGKLGDVASSSDYDNISEFDIVSFGRSSASSTSWNDEFDGEATLCVKNELERLDRILQGKESIPPHYNQDEYEQWMKTFPNLSVFERTDYTSGVEHTKPCLETYNIPSTAPQHKKTTNGIKIFVPDDAYENVSLKVNNGPEHCQHTNGNRTENLIKQFDNVLRISPVLLREPINRSYYLGTKQQSTHSVYKSAKSASKWMREDRQNYTLLPYLANTENPRNKSNKMLNSKPSNLSKLRYSSKASCNKNFISLPPIKTLNIPASAQYRSVSATPRKVLNEQTVVSAHIDSLKRRRKVVYNQVDSIYNIMNYPK